MVSRVINDELAWGAFTFPRGRSVKQTFVHILAVEDVMHITPICPVVAQVVLAIYTASLPVIANELLRNHRIHHRDVNFPLPEPLSPLNEGSGACERRVLLTGAGPTIGSTGKEGANFNVEVPTFKYLDCKTKKKSDAWPWPIIFVPRRRTDVACASKRDGCRESTNAATNDGNFELLEI